MTLSEGSLARAQLQRAGILVARGPGAVPPAVRLKQQTFTPPGPGAAKSRVTSVSGEDGLPPADSHLLPVSSRDGERAPGVLSSFCEGRGHRVPTLVTSSDPAQPPPGPEAGHWPLWVGSLLPQLFAFWKVLP